MLPAEGDVGYGGGQDGAVWKLPGYPPVESLLLLLGATQATRGLKRSISVG